MNTISRAGWLAVLLLCIASRLSAQSGVSDELVRADKQFDLYAYNLALRTYQEVLKKQPNNAHALARIAYCNFQLNKPEESLEFYQKALDTRNTAPEVLLNYGIALMQTGDYAAAKKQFRFYAEQNETVGQHYLKMCDYAINTTKKVGNYVARNEPLNTEAADYAPAFWGTRLVYNSARTDISRKTSSKSVSDWTGSAYNQLFVTQRNPETGFLQKPALMRSDLQSAYNEGPVSFNRTGKTVAFCRNNFINGTRQIAEKGINLSLYFADVDGNGAWSNEKAFFFNGADFATGFPTLSPDGKTLVFASNQEGGYGGWDLYVSNWTANGWSTPTNLGSPLNTPGNEVTPFYDGQNLYFSSDWHDGLGGMDVFRAEFERGDVGSIYQLGAGINSPRDDYGFVYDADQNLGYLTSNRDGGRGNEDIWQITKKLTDLTDNSSFSKTPAKPAIYNTSNTLSPAPDKYLHLLVTDEQGKPIPNAEVDFLDCGCSTGRTDASGKYYFESLSRVVDCKVNLTADGFQDASVALYSFGRQNVLVSMNKDQRHEYTGKVLDARSKEPLYSVVVQFQAPDSDRFIQTSTDNDGRYSITVESGVMHEITYIKEGYLDAILKIKPTKQSGAYRMPDVLMERSSRPYSNDYTANTGNSNLSSKSIQPAPITYSTESVARPKVVYNPPVEIEEPAAITGYSVQLEASPDPITESQLKKHEDLSKYGNVYVKTESSIQKVRLGIYPTKDEALKNMRELNKKAAYKDAFVIEEHSNDRSLVVGPPAAVRPNEYSTKPATYSNSVSAKGLATKGPVPAVLYAVQLGSFNSSKAINVMEYANVAPMGNVYTKTENGMNKIRLGVWPDHRNAEAAQEEAVAQGFKDAIVVTEKGSDESVYGFLLSSVGSKSLPSAQYIPTPSSESLQPATYSTGGNKKSKSVASTFPYYIKIAALAVPERFDATPLADIGGYIEKRKGDKGMTNILLGGFADIESATKAHNKVISKGYEGTYVVKEEKGKLIRQ